MSARITTFRNRCLAAAFAVLTAGLAAIGPARAEAPSVALPPPDDELDCLDVEASLRSTPASVPLGSSATLSWQVTGPRLCIRGLTIENRAVADSGSMAVTPTASRSYSLLMTINGHRAIVATTHVTVTLPIPPDDGTPAIVSINGSTGAWKTLLVNALGRRNTTIRLAETVDMDLTEFPAIFVWGGVNLTSELPPVFAIGKPGAIVGSSGRTAQTPGPRLYTRRAGASFLNLRCSPSDGVTNDSIRFHGFRLHGPHFRTEKGEENLERGIRIRACRGVEISNMEIAGWSGSAIMVEEEFDAAGKVIDSINAADHVRILGNFIHHNQHEGDNGYGVVLDVGTWARVERNVFDHNRHAIVADGKAGTGYLAADNLVLKGGGYHQNYPGYTAYTHQFDVHGDDTCWTHLDCGNAGERFWYNRNAFQYTKDNAIKIRGRPRVLATVDSNVFSHSSVDAAVDGGGNGNIVLGRGALANVAGVASYGAYGVCDFDGDGRDDLLLPTGVTWWYASAARLHWSYLRLADERLAALRFGYFDSDRRCDVLRKFGNTLQISSAGRGAWTALPGSYSDALADLRFADFNADGRTDIFRRAPTAAGEWYVVSPGIHPWRLLGSSTHPLSGLYFGDFDGDDIADILKRSSSTWSIARNGTAQWEPFNGNLGVGASHQLFIADVDSNGRDDIVRFRPTSASLAGGTFEVSRDGRSGWTLMAEVASPAEPPDERRQSATVPTAAFVGRFDAAPGADPLFIDKFRYSHIVSSATRTVSRHGAYPY